MKHDHRWAILVALASSALLQRAAAECAIPEEAQKLDPVEVGFCESDAVFVGKVEQRMETARAMREEGGTRTQHFLTETSTVRVSRAYKGKLPDKVTLTANLYDRKAAFSVQKDQEYLVFAKQASGEDHYAASSPACSVQPSLPIADAQKYSSNWNSTGRDASASTARTFAPGNEGLHLA